MKKFFVSLLIFLLLAAGGTGYAFYWWANAPLQFAPPKLDATIKGHSSLRSVAVQLAQAGVPIQPQLFVALTRVLRLSAQLKAGNYEFETGITPYEVLDKIARGDVNEFVVTVIDGWNFHQMRAELDANPELRHDTAGWSDAQILQALAVPVEAAHHALANPASVPLPDPVQTAAIDPAIDLAEGRFFPDTYLFDKATSDLDIYRRAMTLMDQRLAQLWAARAPDLPYKTPYDALIMASLVEKETGRASDAPLVAAVFVNRLKRGMPLQTDPSVIYGIGSRYSGHLHKKDLQTDGPYNTYTRVGLPPTPIALPGANALQAALNPAQSTALYFVARGDGSSLFSDTLEAHNRAVNKYIRGE